MPVELLPTAWAMPDPKRANEAGLVAIGADLEPSTVIEAYRNGMFPMPIEDEIGWWSPNPRAILPLDALHISRSLRRSLKRYHTTIDQEFESVIDHCGDSSRDHGWISPEIRHAYVNLHRLGWAHSFEVWDDAGDLAGGLYGVAVGSLFAGESMFHLQSDASKVAMVAAVEHLLDGGCEVFDVQWLTGHLKFMGAVEIPRNLYLRLAAAAAAKKIDLFEVSEPTK